jgi:MtfA peptidase
LEVVVVIGVVLLVFALYRNYTAAFSGVIKKTDQKAASFRAIVLPVPERYREILRKYFVFYQKLSTEHQDRFEKKLVVFLHSKRFIPRGIDEVTLEAKVLISASAVQLTFGLPEFYFHHFNKIIVYPNDYYSSITKRYHKGEVNPLFGIIVLSWQSFVDGYIYGQDSFNLGLHEMAHALRLEAIIRNEEYDFFDPNLLERFENYADDFCHHPEKDPNHFIRPYACTNVHEFFSVAVENFFERSEAFRENLPELYAILARLLNQDPLTLMAGGSQTTK